MVEKDQLLYCESTPESLFFRKLENRDRIRNESHRHSLKSAWHNKIRERKGPSRVAVQKSEPQERNPRASKFEGRKPQETLQQERCARTEAWDLARTVLKLKARDMATFYARPKNSLVKLAPSSKEPEE